MAKTPLKFKIIYYGLGGSGRSSNLKSIHERIPSDWIVPKPESDEGPERAPGSMSLNCRPDWVKERARQVLGDTEVSVDLHCAGGIFSKTPDSTLQNVAGVVFVADSNPQKLDDNIEICSVLRESLSVWGEPDFTLVFQWNKRDLPGAVPVERLELEMNKRRNPSLEAIAVQGVGVLETLRMVTWLMWEKHIQKGSPISPF